MKALKPALFALILASATQKVFSQCPYLSINGPSSICTGTAVRYSTSSVPLKQNYTWSVSGGNLISSNGLPYIDVVWNAAFVNGAQSYIQVSYTDGSCLNITSLLNISVSYTETPIINGGTSEICQTTVGGSYVNYQTNPGKSNYKWIVSSGGVISGANNGNSVNVFWTTPGQNTISVSYSSPCPSLVTTKQVLIKAKPNPTISGPAIVCGNTGGHVYTTETGMLDYNWGIENGSFITPKNSNSVTVRWYNGVGSIYVIYSNNVGCSASTIKNISTNFVVGNSILTPDQEICIGSDPVLLKDSSQPSYNGALSYQWLSSDYLEGTYTNIPGATSSTYDPPPLVSNQKFYKKLTYTSLNGNVCPASVLSTAASIRSNDLAGGVIGGNQSICSGGDPIAFTQQVASTGTGVLSHQWQKSLDNSNFANIVGATNLTYDPPAGVAQTTYYKRVTISSAYSCTVSSNVVTVQTNESPSISISPSTVSICKGNSTTLVASGASSYVWSPSTGLSASTGSSVNASPAISTTYTVTGTDSYGCTANKTVFVQINLPPTISISPASASVCQGNSTSLVASGASSYSWSPSSGLSSTFGSSVSASPATNTTYNVIGTDANGCIATSTRAVTVLNRPVPTIFGNNSIAVENSDTYSTQVNNSGYSWSVSQGGTITSGQGTSSITVYWTTIGQNFVTVNYASNGCTAINPTVYSVTVTNPPTPTCSVYISSSGDLCSQGRVSLEAIAQEGTPTSYSWSTGESSSRIFVYYGGYYSVSVYFSNGCSESSSIYVDDVGTAGCIGYRKAADPDQSPSEEPLITATLIFPNPADKEFTIEFDENFLSKYEGDIPLLLINTFGNISSSDVLEKGHKKKVIFTNELTPGIYIVQIGTGKADVVRKKILVVHKN